MVLHSFLHFNGNAVERAVTWRGWRLVVRDESIGWESGLIVRRVAREGLYYFKGKSSRRRHRENDYIRVHGNRVRANDLSSKFET